MTAANPTCREIERDLVAMAAARPRPWPRAWSSGTLLGARVRDELERYRVLEGMVTDLRREAVPGADPALSAAELESRLADIRARMVAYGIFSSPLGRFSCPIRAGNLARRVPGVRRAATSYLAQLAGAK